MIFKEDKSSQIAIFDCIGDFQGAFNIPEEDLSELKADIPTERAELVIIQALIKNFPHEDFILSFDWESGFLMTIEKIIKVGNYEKL